MTIRVNAELFRLAYAAVSKEETRYYLNGVRVEPHPEKGAILVSTDGHRMVCVHDPDAQIDEAAIVKLPPFALALCAAKKGRGLGVDRAILTVDVQAQTATVAHEHSNKEGVTDKSEPLVSAHRVIIEGTFPDWRRVTPKGPFEAASNVAFNSKLLAELGAFGNKLPDKSYGNAMYLLRQTGPEDGGPVVIRWAGIHSVFAVLMPMRAEIETSLPSFLTTEAAAAVAA